jgi:hypothetical protein
MRDRLQRHGRSRGRRSAPITKYAEEPRFYGEVWGVEGKGDRKLLGVCGWLLPELRELNYWGQQL